MSEVDFDEIRAAVRPVFEEMEADIRQEMKNGRSE